MKIWIPQTNPCGLPVARSCGVPVNMRSASSSEPPSGGSELRRLRLPPWLGDYAVDFPGVAPKRTAGGHQHTDRTLVR